jgi:hypothetical protein
MSTKEVSKRGKTSYIESWKNYPMEIKIMDLATVAWLAIIIVNVLIEFLITDVNVRTFPIFIFPVFMFIVTIALRLQLIDKPNELRNIFITWCVLFGLMLLFSIFILIFFPAVYI